MSKDKISDYSATANSNTDIGGVNIDEGCAPSGINDAIRTLMKQLKDFQQGTNSDSFNGPHNGTVGATTPAAGTFTTLTSTGNTVLGDASTDTLNVGNGGLVKDASGNVGIGTSTLNDKFNLYSATSVYQRFQNSSTGTGATDGFQIGNDASGAYIWNYENSSTLFATNNAERMRIDSSGNLLVGTTSANGKIAAAVADGSTNVFYVERTGGSPATLAVNFANQYTNFNSSVRYQIVAGGSGGVYLGTGATSWASASDGRLKTELTPFVNAASKVATLRAGTGRYLTDDESVSRTFLIAQDVQAVLPEAVDIQTDEQGTLGLRYTDLIPLLTAAIQEQQALITSLTERLTALENK